MPAQQQESDSRGANNAGGGHVRGDELALAETDEERRVEETRIRLAVLCRRCKGECNGDDESKKAEQRLLVFWGAV